MHFQEILYNFSYTLKSILDKQIGLNAFGSLLFAALFLGMKMAFD